MKKANLFRVGILAGVLLLVLALTGTSLADKAVVIGYHIDYDRLTTIGPPVGQGMKDYIKVFNKNGGRYSSNVTSQEITDLGTYEINLTDDFALFAEYDSMFQIRFPETDIRVRVKD